MGFQLDTLNSKIFKAVKHNSYTKREINQIHQTTGVKSLAVDNFLTTPLSCFSYCAATALLRLAVTLKCKRLIGRGF